MRFHYLRPRRLLGGPASAPAGQGSLTRTNGGSLNPVPNWMRFGFVGCAIGWFTPTAAVADGARLFYFANSNNTDYVECYADLTNTRWVWVMVSASTVRASCYINGAMPASGVTVGFALSWRLDRMIGAVGANVGTVATLPDSSLNAKSLTQLYLGNRADGSKQLSASFHALEYFDYSPAEAMIGPLAARALPVAQPRV